MPTNSDQIVLSKEQLVAAGFDPAILQDIVTSKDTDEVSNVLTINDALDESRFDTTPTLKPQEEDILIMGNPNDVVEDINEYIVKFYGIQQRQLRQFSSKDDQLVNDSFDSETGTLTLTYKAKSITPALSEKLAANAQIIQSSFLGLTEEGEIEYMSREALINQAKFFAGEGIDATRNFLQVYFGFDKEMVDYIPATEACRLYAQIVRNNPNFFQ